MRKLTSLALFCLIILGGYGCKSDKGGSDSPSNSPAPAPAPPAPNPGQPDPGQPEPPAVNPLPPIAGYVPPMQFSESFLLKNIEFLPAAEDFYSEERLQAIQNSLLECGLKRNLTPRCKGNYIKSAQLDMSLYIQGPFEGSTLSFQILKVGNSNHYLYILRYGPNFPETNKETRFAIYTGPATEENLKQAGENLRRRLLELGPPFKTENFEEDLNITLIGVAENRLFANEDEFYQNLKTGELRPREFYHLVEVIQEEVYNHAKIIEAYSLRLQSLLAWPTDVELRSQFLLQSYDLFESEEEKQLLVEKIKNQFQDEELINFKRQLAVMALLLGDNEFSYRDLARDFYFEKLQPNANSRPRWLAHVITLTDLIGPNFIGESWLISYADHKNFKVRTAVAKGIHHYHSLKVYKTNLALCADSHWEARDFALESMQKRPFSDEGFSFSDLLENKNHNQRKGLASCLKYVTSRSSNLALLKFAVDNHYTVRNAALESLVGRTFSVGNFDIFTLVNNDSANARISLAQALAHVEDVDTLLMRLLADQDYRVRNAALKVLESKNIDLGNTLDSSYINSDSVSARVDTAQGLRFTRGLSRDILLLRLVVDENYRVRNQAVEVLKERPISLPGILDFKIESLLNTDTPARRESLAEALAFVTGADSGSALIRLAADTNYRVRDAALKSLAEKNINLGVSEETSLINLDNVGSREGLATALEYAHGFNRNITLLKLITDENYRVRDAARKSVSKKPIDLQGGLSFEVSALTKIESNSARLSLAEALRYIDGSDSDSALVKLIIDSDYRVRDQALATLKIRETHSSNWEMESYLQHEDINKRIRIVEALPYLKGGLLGQTVAKFSVDKSRRIRDKTLEILALSSTNKEMGDSFDPATLIDVESTQKMISLAKALGTLKGAKVIPTLMKLIANGNQRVVKEAQASLRAQGYDI